MTHQTNPSRLHQVTIHKCTALHTSDTWELFEAGMLDNASETSDACILGDISDLLNFARPQFRDMSTFLFAENGGALFVALTPSGETIGMIGVRRSAANMREQLVELTRISVSRNWRRKGICSMLVNHAIAYSWAQFAVRGVYLYTHGGLKSAVTAYSRLGFTVVVEDSNTGSEGVDVTKNTRIIKLYKRVSGNAVAS